MTWIHATSPGEEEMSGRWAAAVGPPIVLLAPPTAEVEQRLTLVSWNTHVGAGDVRRLVTDLRAGSLTGHPVGNFALLLQEVVRVDGVVPAGPPAGSRFARRQHPRPEASATWDVAALARDLRLSLAYVPSMRNGREQEDRGNAILTSLPIDEVVAIELPLEHQRRVAIAASVPLRISAERTVRLRIATTHFTNTVGHHLWLFAEPARVRQARALARALPDDGSPTVVGGDLNSWFGFLDAGYRELARAFPSPRPSDRRATFGPMRLDHVLYRLPPDWRVAVRRLDSKYGSDHYPLLAQIEAAAPTRPPFDPPVVDPVQRITRPR